MNWFLNLFNRSIKVGSRVQTEFGMGTVKSGTLIIEYDDNSKLPFKGRVQHPNNKHWAHNINNVTLR